MTRSKILNCNSLVFLMFLLFVSNIAAKDYEAEKEYDRSYNTASISKLIVSNKHGNVIISDNHSESITIHIKVKVVSPKESNVDELLRNISVDFEEEDGVLRVTTEFGKTKDIFTRNKFSVDYDIIIPDSKALDIKNYYGNISIDRLNAAGKFVSKYGAFYAGDLLFPTGENGDIFVGYGKCEIENVNNADIDVEYSKLRVTQGDKLDIDSKYSGVRLGRLNSLKLNSQFDGIDVEFVKMADMDCSYSGVEILELANKIKANCSFGGVKINNVHTSFNSVDITNSYGSIKIGLPQGGAFNVDLESSFGGITIPDNWGLNINSDSNEKNTKGKIGDSSTNKVALRVKFGSIKVYEVPPTN